MRLRVAAGTHHHVAVLKGDAALGEGVEQLAIVAHHDADAAKRLECAGELDACVMVEVVGRLIGHQHVRSAPQGHGDLQLLALAA